MVFFGVAVGRGFGYDARGCAVREVRRGLEGGRTRVVLHLDLLLTIAEQEELESIRGLISAVFDHVVRLHDDASAFEHSLPARRHGEGYSC